jgi:hypothetical protein
MASGSFLKKEPKNFCESGLGASGKAEAETIKSLLLLFFRKEDLSLMNLAFQIGAT